MCNVILNVSEESLYKYARLFLPNGRQNLLVAGRTFRSTLVGAEVKEKTMTK